MTCKHHFKLGVGIMNTVINAAVGSTYNDASGNPMMYKVYKCIHCGHSITK